MTDLRKGLAALAETVALMLDGHHSEAEDRLAEVGRYLVEPWPDLGDDFPQTNLYQRVAADPLKAYREGLHQPYARVIERAVEAGFLPVVDPVSGEQEADNAEWFRIAVGWLSGSMAQLRTLHERGNEIMDWRKENWR